MIFNDQTNKFFEAVVIEDDWSSAARILSEALDDATVFLTSGNPKNPESFSAHTHNFDGSVFKGSNFTEASHFDPRVNSSIPVVYTSSVGQIFDRRDYCNDDDFKRDAFYSDIMISQDLFYTKIVKLVQEADLLSGCFIAVSERRGPIEGDLLQRFENWCPAIQTMLHMAQKLKTKVQVNQGLKSAIEHLDKGIAVVDPSLKILSSNAAAEKIFAESRSIKSRNGSLFVEPLRLQRTMAIAVRQMIDQRNSPSEPAPSFFVPGFDGLPQYEVTILPAHGVSQELSKPAAAATIVIEDLYHARDLPTVEWLRTRFRLTEMQAKVTRQALLPFSSKRELAQKLGLEESTVRSHLAAARASVGGNNLHEFVQLVSGARWHETSE